LERSLPRNESSTGANVPWNESSWNIHSRVPQERMFHGTKVPRERKFSLWTFCSRERKRRGTKRPGIDEHRPVLSGCAIDGSSRPVYWSKSVSKLPLLKNQLALILPLCVQAAGLLHQYKSVNCYNCWTVFFCYISDAAVYLKPTSQRCIAWHAKT